MADDRFEAYRAMFGRDKLNQTLSDIHPSMFLDILEESVKIAKRDEELGTYDIIRHVLQQKGYNEKEV